MKNTKSKLSNSLIIAFVLLLAAIMLFGTACGDKSNTTDTTIKKPTTLTIGKYDTGTQFAGKYYIQMGSYPQTKCEVQNPQLVSGKTYNFKNLENEVYTDGTYEYVKYNDEFFKIEPVKWVIIGDGNGNSLSTFSENSKGAFTVVSEKILVQQIYNQETSLNNRWNGSEIQSFMNEKLFDDLFTADEKACIKNTVLKTTYKGQDGTIEETTSNGDKMFLLGMKDQTKWGDSAVRGDSYTIDLIEQLMNGNDSACEAGSAYDSLKAYKTDLADATGCYGSIGESSYWWLRSGDYEQGDSVGEILQNGAINTTTVSYDNIGLRGAFQIELV